jgi:protein-tyrosine phosphatase
MTAYPESELRRRAVALVGTHNFRDVGGYETQDGGFTRWRRLFRSDALHALDAADTDFAGLALRTVVDLRTDTERADYPDVLPADGPALVVLPLLNGNLEPMPASLDEVYDHLVEVRGAAIASVISALAAPGALPAVVHCTAGQDRTGVVTALLLSSLGVPDDTVAADFAATELFLTTEFVGVLTTVSGHAPTTHLLGAEASLMYRLLARVADEHGGARSFLLANGLTEAEHDRLREQLVTYDREEPPC